MKLPLFRPRAKIDLPTGVGCVGWGCISPQHIACPAGRMVQFTA